MFIFRSRSIWQGSIYILLLSGLLSCRTAPPEPVPQPAPVAEVSLPDAAELEAAFHEELRQQLEVADILYQALRALREDRLMTPPEGSALSLFNRVLGMQPENAVALQGIQDIAQRYLQLSAQASWQGNFDSAQLYLQRARTVYPEHEALPAAVRSLEIERERTHSVHTLDNRQLTARSAELVSRLHELAGKAREINAFVMITAPNDTLGRWIYAQMQDAAGEYRLRADIEISDQAAIRLVVEPARS